MVCEVARKRERAPRYFGKQGEIEARRYDLQLKEEKSSMNEKC